MIETQSNNHVVCIMQVKWGNRYIISICIDCKQPRGLGYFNWLSIGKDYWRVPWTARRSNQSVLKISPEYSLEGLTLRLKLQYFGRLMWTTDSFQKTLMLEKKLKVGGEGDDRGWDGWMSSPTQLTWVCISSGSWWWWGSPGVLQSMGSWRVRHDWVTELNWTAVKNLPVMQDTGIQYLGQEIPLL